MVIDLAHEAEKIMLTTQRQRHRLDSAAEKMTQSPGTRCLAERLLEQKHLGQQALTLSNIAPNNDTSEENAMVYWLRMPPTPSPFAQQRVVDPISVAPSSSSPMPAVLQAENSPVLHGQLVQTSTLLKRHVFTPIPPLFLLVQPLGRQQLLILSWALWS